MKAAAQVMRDALAEADPPGTSLYAANTERVMRELDELDWEIRGIYASLPEASKNLITTHDGYRYLASTYGLTVAGFVTPVAGSEPSIQQRQRLQRTIRDLRVPAISLIGILACEAQFCVRSPMKTGFRWVPYIPIRSMMRHPTMRI